MFKTVTVGVVALVLGFFMGAVVGHSATKGDFSAMDKKVAELEKHVTEISKHIDEAGKNLGERAKEVAEHIKQKFQEIDSRINQLAMRVKEDGFGQPPMGGNFRMANPWGMQHRMEERDGEDEDMERGHRDDMRPPINPERMQHQRKEMEERRGEEMKRWHRNNVRPHMHSSEEDDDLNWLFKGNKEN